MGLGDEAADAAYALGWNLVRSMPERVARRQFDGLADLIWMRQGRSVRRLTANLRRVVGPGHSDRALRALSRDGVQSYFRYWCEVFQMPAMRTEDLVARMTVAEDYRLREAYAAGNGMILALPHMGNWDHAGAWLVGTGVPFTTVAERLKPESLFDRFVAFRESLGMEVIALTGGERPPYDVLAERLRAGGALCLLSDRDLTRSGVEVEFFGAIAKMPAGPAALALDTGAALLPVTLTYPERFRWAGRIHPQVLPPRRGTRVEKVAAMTQQLADAFAGAIAESPQDWHMFQRLWVEDLDPSRAPRERVA